MNAQQPNVQEATLETLSSDAASFCDKQTAMELHFDDDPSDDHVRYTRSEGYADVKRYVCNLVDGYLARSKAKTA